MKAAPSVRIANVRCDCGRVGLRLVLPGDLSGAPIRGWCSAACWQRACERPHQTSPEVSPQEPRHAG